MSSRFILHPYFHRINEFEIVYWRTYEVWRFLFVYQIQIFLWIMNENIFGWWILFKKKKLHCSIWKRNKIKPKPNYGAKYFRSFFIVSTSKDKPNQNVNAKCIHETFAKHMYKSLSCDSIQKHALLCAIFMKNVMLNMFRVFHAICLEFL